MSLLKTSTQQMVSTQREEAFSKLRQFHTDPSQGGETLATSAPVMLGGTRSLAARRAYLVRLAYKPETQVAAISLITPPELCWASKHYPFNWEMYASLIASHSKIIDVTNKGSNPSPRCSFLNALKGAYLEGILPSPQVVLSSTAFCEAVSYVFEELATEFNVPHIHLDIPSYSDELSIKNMKSQLESAFWKMSEISKLPDKEAEANLRKATYLSTKAKQIYNEISEIRERLAPLNLGLEPLHWHFLFSALWGDESGVRVSQLIKNDLEELIKKESWRAKYTKGLPIAIFSLIEYGRTNLYKKMLEKDAFCTFEGANYLGKPSLLNLDEVYEMSLDKIFNNMAENLVNTPMRGGSLKTETDTYMDSAKIRGSKGLVIYSHEHCQMLAPRLHVVESKAIEHDIKAISLNGDCILGIPPGPAGIRLGTFMDNLKNDGMGDTKGDIRVIDNQIDHKNNTEWRVGVDFGSGYSKYTVIDRNNMVIMQKSVNSGIDYNSILELVKKQISNEKSYSLAITGVGSDNPNFSNLWQKQLTEISALINATKSLFSKEKEIVIVDIGTQDVKIIKFDGIQPNPWINTNKSCGAGTGMVLAQILERWQQSIPTMTFQKLDDLAVQAEKSELINTTCGIFAVTNVISALVQADDKRRNIILKGVYHYLATQAIKLLPSNDQNGCRVVLTGGLANHKTLRAIFEEKGFELVDIPNNLHPHFMVSYGAAISI